MKRNLYYPKTNNKIEDDETMINNNVRDLTYFGQKLKQLKSKNKELELHNAWLLSESYKLKKQIYQQQNKIDNLEDQVDLILVLQKQLECEKKDSENLCFICMKYCNAFIFPCCDQQSCHVCVAKIEKASTIEKQCPYCRSTLYWDINTVMDTALNNNEHFLVEENGNFSHTG